MLRLHVSVTTFPTLSVGSAFRVCEPHDRSLVLVGAKGRKGRKKKKASSEVWEDASVSTVARVGLVPTNKSARIQIYEQRERERLMAESQQPQRRLSTPKRNFLASSQKRRSQQQAEQLTEEQNRIKEFDGRRNALAARFRSQGICLVYRTASQPKAPVVVVDGYNVLYLIQRRRSQSQKGGLALQAEEKENAKLVRRYKQEGLVLSPGKRDGCTSEQLALMRKEIEDAVQAYAAAEEFKAYVVWDSLSRAGETADVTTEVRDPILTVAFTSGMEADTHLIEAARQFIAQGARFVQVVTSDREAATITWDATHDIVVTSSHQFVEEMDRTTRQTEEDLVLNSLQCAAQGHGTMAEALMAALSDPKKEKQIMALIQPGSGAGAKNNRQAKNKRPAEKPNKRAKQDDGEEGTN